MTYVWNPLDLCIETCHPNDKECLENCLSECLEEDEE